MGHNALKDTEAKFLRENCCDVKTEPELLSTGSDVSANRAEKARLDISTRGLWSKYERSFFDVSVTHQTAASYYKPLTRKSLDVLYRKNKMDKKITCEDHILDVEKGSFIFRTT